MQSALSEFDLSVLVEETHKRAYEKMGARLSENNGRRGVQLADWLSLTKTIPPLGLAVFHPESHDALQGKKKGANGKTAR